MRQLGVHNATDAMITQRIAISSSIWPEKESDAWKYPEPTPTTIRRTHTRVMPGSVHMCTGIFYACDQTCATIERLDIMNKALSVYQSLYAHIACPDACGYIYCYAHVTASPYQCTCCNLGKDRSSREETTGRGYSRWYCNIRRSILTQNSCSRTNRHRMRLVETLRRRV